MEGYVKLFRKILDSEVWENQNAMRVFTWCLLKAAYRGHFVSTITGSGKTTVWLEPGQFITGRMSGADETKMAPSTFRNTLKFLKGRKMVELKPDSHFTIITVCNWVIYQCDNPEIGQADIQADIQAQDTNNKDRIVKKGTSAVFIPPQLSEITKYFSEFIQTRKYSLDPNIEAERFEAYYASVAWRVGKNPMRDWKKAASGWLLRASQQSKPLNIKHNMEVKGW